MDIGDHREVRRITREVEGGAIRLNGNIPGHGRDDSFSQDYDAEGNGRLGIRCSRQRNVCLRSRAKKLGGSRC